MIKEVTENEVSIINSFTNEYQVTLNNNPYNKAYYLEVNNEIIGFIEYAIIYDKGELNYIFVSNKYRKYGYGNQLLDYMFKELSNVTNITLEVNINNAEAINLYLKNGFKVVSKREKYYNGTDGYLMLKEVL